MAEPATSGVLEVGTSAFGLAAVVRLLLVAAAVLDVLDFAVVEAGVTAATGTIDSKQMIAAKANFSTGYTVP